MNTPYTRLQGVHLLPGRIRVCVANLKHNQQYAHQIESYLMDINGINYTDANIYTGKVLIYFDTNSFTVSEVLKNLTNAKHHKIEKKVNYISKQHQSLVPSIISSSFLIGYLGKHMLFGASSIAASTSLMAISGLATISIGYPHLRKLINKLSLKTNIAEETIVSTATLGTLALRESTLGFSVLSAIGLTSLWNHSRIEQNKRLFSYQLTPTSNGPVSKMFSAADEGVINYFPSGVRQPLLLFSIATASLALLTSNWPKMLAILVIGCPCAFTLARKIPNGLGIATSAQNGILVSRQDAYHRLSECKIAMFKHSNEDSILPFVDEIKANGYIIISVDQQSNYTIDTINNYHKTGKPVLYIGTNEKDIAEMNKAHVNILLGKNKQAADYGDICIPSPDGEKLNTLWNITKNIHHSQAFNYNAIITTQISLIGLTLFGIIGLPSALNIHHGINLVVLLNSLISKANIAKKHNVKPQKRNYHKNIATTNRRRLKLANIVKLEKTNYQTGLTTHQINHRLGLYGYNRLPDPEKISLLRRLTVQCKGTMALVMLGGTGISLLSGGILDGLALGGLFLVNTFIGVFQSNKADNAVGKLNQMSEHNTLVLRNGEVKHISSEQLVPGDIIYLKPGDSIPADSYLITKNELVVDESLLTGESKGIMKKSQEGKLSELAAGTSVLKGKGICLVVRTGSNTRMGKIALMLRQDNSGPTPLQINLQNLGSFLVKGLVIVCGAVFLLGVVKGQTVSQMALTSASIAAATVPQGLTTFVTLGLVAGVRELAKRKTVVRKLAALEQMACVTCLCLDKTGTITQNQMTVRQIYTDKYYTVTGDGRSKTGKFLTEDVVFEPLSDPTLTKLLKTAVICNDAQLNFSENETFEVQGDGTEVALLVMAEKAGIKTNEFKKQFTCLDESPFSSERERMSVLVREKNNTFLTVKGSPESVLEICSLSTEAKAYLLEQAHQMASSGLRVLAIAEKNLPKENYDISPKELEVDLSFLGLVGMMDPPRKNVNSVIKRCKEAGIHVVMLTGDHPETAMSIGKEIGLSVSKDKTLTGKQLAELPRTQLPSLLKDITIFSRVGPDQKQEVVNSLKQAGFVVAMAGDGINDSPALKAADVGISMGSKGTDVAQESSDVILVTNDLKQIITAVEQGRTAYDNIGKVISYLLTSNAGELSLMLSASASGMAMPLLPIQLLWVNLLGDGPPALALCIEPSDGQTLTRQAHKKDGTILTETIKRRIVLKGLRMGIVTLGLYGFSIWQGVPMANARTRTLAALGVEQILHLFESRIVEPGLPVPDNPTAKKTAWLSAGLLLTSIYLPPIQKIFHLVPLQLVEWLLVLGFAIIATPPIISNKQLPMLNTPKKRI